MSLFTLAAPRDVTERPTAATRPRLVLVGSAAERRAAAPLVAVCEAAGWDVAPIAGPDDAVLDVSADQWTDHGWRFQDSRGRPVLDETALQRVWERPPYCLTILLCGGSDQAGGQAGGRTVTPQWARIGTRGPLPEVRARIHATAALLLARALRGLPACGEAPEEVPASSWADAFGGWLAHQVALWQSRLWSEWWSIGIVEQPIADVVRNGRLGPVRWLRPERGRAYWADPFVWPGTGRLLCEELAPGGVGEIVALSPHGTGWRRERSLIAGRTHQSYPFTIETAGAVYVLPETAEAGVSKLYRLADDGSLAEVACVAEKPLADATLFAHGGRWWVAATDLAIGPHDNLCLFHAAQLAGPWRPHRGNPVKLDICGARSAGTPFVVDGRLYRPAQDCARTYGAAVAVSEVITLTEEEFVERAVLRLAPEPGSRLPHGLHTLSDAGNRTLVDGKRMTFTPWLAVQKAARKSARLWLARPPRAGA